MRLVSLIQHPLTLRDVGGTDHIVPPSGTVARVHSVPGTQREIAGLMVPVYGPDGFGAVEGLPAPREGVCYVVSAIVGLAVAKAGGRDDVLVLGTGPADETIRDAKGAVIAVTRLKRP